MPGSRMHVWNNNYYPVYKCTWLVAVTVFNVNVVYNII
jgi:hypothetical protein